MKEVKKFSNLKGIKIMIAVLVVVTCITFLISFVYNGYAVGIRKLKSDEWCVYNVKVENNSFSFSAFVNAEATSLSGFKTIQKGESIYVIAKGARPLLVNRYQIRDYQNKIKGSSIKKVFIHDEKNHNNDIMIWPVNDSRNNAGICFDDFDTGL